MIRKGLAPHRKALNGKGIAQTGIEEHSNGTAAQNEAKQRQSKGKATHRNYMHGKGMATQRTTALRNGKKTKTTKNLRRQPHETTRN